jgi:hypothetical protein
MDYRHKISLHSLLRDVIIEHLINEESTKFDASTFKAGAAFDAMEIAAKEKYEAAQAALSAWDINDKMKQDFLAKAKSAGISVDTARKRFGKDPKYAYDPKLAQKKRQTLEDEFKKAEEEYAEYEPKLRGYVRTRASGGAKTLANKEMPPADKHVYFSIEDVKPLVWYTWPKEVAKSGKSFGSAKTKTGEEVSGTGPGEEWLSFIFGGQMQGGGVSYDIVTPDSRAWEVKALESAADTIRPGTEGLKAFDVPKKRLETIMRQLKNFTILARKTNFFEPDDLVDEDKRIIDFVVTFIEDDYEMIVGKGEISRDRFIAFRGVLKALGQFKRAHAPKDEDPDTRVALNDKEVKVDKPTYIDVAKRIEKATGEQDLLSEFEKFDLLTATLKDVAFDNPTEFFDEWFQSVDINRVFEQVDGVFIVNMRGFLMVPRSMFKKAFRFDKVTQGKPRFVLALPFGP